MGLTSLEVHNKFFNITEEENTFELYGFPDWVPRKPIQKEKKILLWI